LIYLLWWLEQAASPIDEKSMTIKIILSTTQISLLWNHVQFRFHCYPVGCYCVWQQIHSHFCCNMWRSVKKQSLSLFLNGIFMEFKASC